MGFKNINNKAEYTNAIRVAHLTPSLVYFFTILLLLFKFNNTRFKIYIKKNTFWIIQIISIYTFTF